MKNSTIRYNFDLKYYLSPHSYIVRMGSRGEGLLIVSVWCDHNKILYAYQLRLWKFIAQSSFLQNVQNINRNHLLSTYFVVSTQ